MNWAVIDENGFILEHGFAAPADIFAQRGVLAPGHAFVTRPETVTCFEPWRYVNGEWILEASK